ncbi:MAG: hypothetical protein ABR597_11685 [Bacteroidales bacterium]
MKTLNQIILTATLIIMSINLSFAGSEKTFEMRLNNGKVIQVLSKVEEAIEETIPGYNEFVNEYRQSKFEITHMPEYIEQPVEEDLPKYTEEKNYGKDDYLGVLLSSISKPEEEVEDNFSFDTKEVFAQIQREKRTELTNGTLAKFIKPEKEIEESLPAVCAGFLSAK